MLREGESGVASGMRPVDYACSDQQNSVQKKRAVTEDATPRLEEDQASLGEERSLEGWVQAEVAESGRKLKGWRSVAAR